MVAAANDVYIVTARCNVQTSNRERSQKNELKILFLFI